MRSLCTIIQLFVISRRFVINFGRFGGERKGRQGRGVNLLPAQKTEHLFDVWLCNDSPVTRCIFFRPTYAIFAFKFFLFVTHFVRWPYVIGCPAITQFVTVICCEAKRMRVLDSDIYWVATP